MWHSNSFNPFRKLTDQSTDDPVEWKAAAHPSLRIEAILSGQAIITCEREEVQPCQQHHTSFAQHRVAPFPHTVVVIKQRIRRKPEKRARRVGRISRQFIQHDDCGGHHGKNETDEAASSEDCCHLSDFLPCWWKKPNTFISGPLIMC